MRQRLINWLRETSFVKRLVLLDDLKSRSSNCKTFYDHFYHPDDPHRVDHWKERHNQLVKQYNEEKYWWMSKLENM